jgi:thiol-disulfide isomerase/thioredoxin
MAFQVNLPNEEAWTKEIASSQTGVVQGVIVTLKGDGLLVTDSLQSQWLCCAVVEVYQDWCGPCKAVITSLKKQFFELGERPLKFYTVRFRFAASEALI